MTVRASEPVGEERTPPRVAFALSGGGAHGAAQVGMLQGLLGAGIVPDVLVGCSVGALNAVYVAADPTVSAAERLADVWRSLHRRDVFGSPRRRPLLNALARRDHVYESTALMALIARICPVADLADLNVETHVVTTDLDHARPVWWTQGPAHSILAASTCLPGIFAPVVLHGAAGLTRHVDGGVVAPIPVKYAADLQVDVVYVLDVARGTAPAPEKLNAMDVLLRSFSISRYANLPDPASLARPGLEIVYLPSPDTFGRDMRDFSHSERYIDDARKATSMMLAHRAATAAPGLDKLDQRIRERGWLHRWRHSAA